MAVQVPAIPQLAPSIRQVSQKHETTRRFFQSTSAVVGLVVIIGWILIAIFAGLIAGDPYGQDPLTRLEPPSSQNPFGTDELGRDVYSRVLHGARISLPVGVVVIVFSALLGSLLGAFAGFTGQRVDEVIMRVVDVVLAFPSIVLAMAISAVLGPSLVNAVIAIIVVWWPEYARMMRGQVLAAKENEYIFAARALGVPERRILFHHILPGAMPPILVKASLDIGSAVVFIASLSFIGLGVVPPAPEWGAMIAAGRVKFFDWWLATFPGLAIVSVVLAFNYIGDGMRDALDPRLRRR